MHKYLCLIVLSALKNIKSVRSSSWWGKSSARKNVRKWRGKFEIYDSSSSLHTQKRAISSCICFLLIAKIVKFVWRSSDSERLLLENVPTQKQAHVNVPSENHMKNLSTFDEWFLTTNRRISKMKNARCRREIYIFSGSLNEWVRTMRCSAIRRVIKNIMRSLITFPFSFWNFASTLYLSPFYCGHMLGLLHQWKFFFDNSEQLS